MGDKKIIVEVEIIFLERSVIIPCLWSPVSRFKFVVIGVSLSLCFSFHPFIDSVTV